MNQPKVTTYALMTRCDLTDAAKLKAVADKQGVTLSAYVAILIKRAAARVKISDENWAENQLEKNTKKREAVDARVHAGCDRKPGWEQTKRFRKEA